MYRPQQQLAVTIPNHAPATVVAQTHVAQTLNFSGGHAMRWMATQTTVMLAWPAEPTSPPPQGLLTLPAECDGSSCWAARQSAPRPVARRTPETAAAPESNQTEKAAGEGIQTHLENVVARVDGQLCIEDRRAQAEGLQEQPQPESRVDAVHKQQHALVQQPQPHQC